VPLDIPREELTVRLERAFLVSVELPGRPWVGDDPLEEIRGLTTTAGALVVGGTTQRRQRINPATYVGKGKVEELQQQVRATDGLSTARS
jgi:GTP-binding protein HflX